MGSLLSVWDALRTLTWRCCVMLSTACLVLSGEAGYAQQWSVETLSIARTDIGATAVGTKAMFAGGDVGGQLTDIVDIYDSTQAAWSTAHLSSKRGSVAATSYGERAYFIGGYSQTGGASQDVDIYDDTSGAWTSMRSGLSVGRQSPSARLRLASCVLR